jgi:hypothetical protein|tara:strand:- start:222 stop:995 length:774 start_codon:yes stop_codon:yes gene_type:complete
MIGIEYTGTVRCSFCGTPGHNVTSCPQVEVIAEDAQLKQAAGYPITYRHRQAVYEMKRREQRKAKKRIKPRTKAKCSFCRNENHRRPSCRALKTLREKIYRANANWKRNFAKTINEAGVGIGALVMIPTQILDWSAGKDDWSTCMILEYDLDTLNVFSSYGGRDNFRTTARMKLVTVDGMQQELNWPFDRIAPFHNRGLTSRGYNYGVTKVLSECEWQPPDGWFDEKNTEIEYVLKKITFDNSTIQKNMQTLLRTWE